MGRPTGQARRCESEAAPPRSSTTPKRAPFRDASIYEPEILELSLGLRPSAPRPWPSPPLGLVHKVGLGRAAVGRQHRLFQLRTVRFHEAPAPIGAELAAVVRRTSARVARWLARRGSFESQSDEDPDAIGACAAAAMQRGLFVELPEQDEDDTSSDVRHSDTATEHMGFNLHAGVRISADDDVGRERLCRYGARLLMVS